MTSGHATDLTEATATELLARMEAGEISSRVVLERQLEHIAELDGRLNTIVALDEERARREADQRDDERRHGRVRGRLHGLPITVKDAFATAGLRTAAGSNELMDHVPNEDAPAVARLRGAGAIVVGKTACPEGVSGQETASSSFGTTRNPWDTSRTPGGSSGGAAAAVAVGFTPLELGSDMGGSIRQPASFCGVFGHYPTHGVVPTRGHLPSVPVDDVEAHKDLLAVGPLARSAEDLELALDVLAGPDRFGRRAFRLELPPAPAREPRDLRVAVWLDDADFPVSDEVVEVLSSAADDLVEAGAELDRTARPAFSLVEAERVGFDLWVAASSGGLDQDDLAEQERLAGSLPADDDRRAARRARAATMSHRDWLQLDAHRRQLERAWEELFQRVDVVLCPAVPVTAFEVSEEPGEVHRMRFRLAATLDVNGEQRPYLDQLVWTTAVGLARLPATVAPVGLARSGLPVGVQIVAGRYQDRTALRAASILSSLTGGFRPPPVA